MMKNKHITIVLVVAGWLLPIALRGQAVATLSADTILLGDQTTLTISHTAEFPSTDMLTRDGIVALDQRFDTATASQATVLTCFEPGDRYVRFSPDDSLLLVVLDVEVDTSANAEIRDIANIERVPYTFWEIFRWVLLTMAILAIAFLAWWLYTHRRKIQQVLGVAEPIDTRTPEQRALDTLEELRNRKLWQSGKVKEYHTELTDAVRRFIEESTSIRATDMTSDETLSEIESSKLKIETSLLRDIFTTADLVKFAKSEPLPHEHDRSMANAVEFVKQMWQLVKPQEEEAAHE